MKNLTKLSIILSAGIIAPFSSGAVPSQAESHLEAMSANPASADANTIKVTGVVTDEAGEEIIGAAVMQKGTNIGATTNIDGAFALEVAPGTTLVISYIGYESQEVKAAPDMKIVLKESSKALEEVVVIGYGIQKKSSVTGAISKVKSDDLNNRTVSNPESALQGKTAGVQFINTGSSPAAAPTIRVRGYSSNVASEPLYVVDGVRLSSISGIDPNDIESIEVLKDAASAAIYGAEAGNGVVMVTTKKGNSPDGKISYSFMYSIQTLAHKPKLLNAEEYINYMQEGNIITSTDLQTLYDGVTDTDWIDSVFGHGHLQKHNISFSKGNESGNYYLSLSYLNNDGILKGNTDYYNRMTATINGEQNIKKWLTVGTTNQIEKYRFRTPTSHNETQSPFAAVMLMDPLTAVTYTPDNLPTHMADALAEGHTLLTDENGNYYGQSRWYQGNLYNPFVMLKNYESANSGFNVNGSIYGMLKPFAGFTLTSRFGYRLSGNRQSNTNLPYWGSSAQMRDNVNLNSQSSTTIYYMWENFINYYKSFGKNNLSAMLGMSYQDNSYQYVYGKLDANGEDVVTKNDPLFYYLNYSTTSSIKTAEGEKTRTTKLSYFGRVSYDYNGKYFLQASLRADAADLSKLPKKKRWGYFPAASIGWRISEENFFEGLRPYIDNLKIRGSWGRNGSLSALSGYLYSTVMATGNAYSFVDGNTYVTSVYPTSLGNDELKWETSEQTNVGFDLNILHNRLSFSFDFFEKKTKDLLISNTTPSLIIGGSTSPINAGNVSNRGVEFEVNWRDSFNDFTYSVAANLATLRNRVTYLDPSLERVEGTTYHNRTISYFEEGYPIYYFRGYKFDGVDPATGDPTFQDLNGDGEITADDQTYIGDAIPDITYGITLTAAWKGLDLTVFGSGSAGNKIFHASYRPDYPTSNKMKEIFYDNRWTETNTSGTVPRANANGMDKYIVSDAMIYDGSYFKIKQIQLGYTLPKKWMQKLYISRLRVYGTLEDFFTFTKYPGFDPEASSNATSGMGIDKGGYPTSKKVVFGLNLEF